MKQKPQWQWTFIMSVFLLLSLPVVLHAQEQSIQGIVSYDRGTPLQGATVFIKGTTIGTTTGPEGEFSIPARQGDILVISFIGYTTREVPVSGTNLSITMTEEAVSLDDVVVVGYGTVKKSDLTGSVSTVKVETLTKTPANSIENLLQGRSAGLQIITSSQDPGSGSTVRIRGESSLQGSNAPLMVVDGFPMGDAGNLKQINPADIVSVEILKDASASAIYGSRGANGVIIVTTRKAKEGTTRVNITQQTTLSQFTSGLNVWDNSVLLAQISNEGRINAGYVPLYTGTTFSNGVYYPSVSELESGAWPYHTNWGEVVFREFPVSNNTVVSINSANSTSSFNLSVNNFDEQGVYIQDDYNKQIVNLGVTHKVKPFLTISTSNVLTRGYRNYNGGLAYYRNPMWPVYNEDGTYFLTGDNDYSNPMALTDLRTNTTNTIDLYSSWAADLSITPHLKVRSQLNYKYGSYVNDTYNPDIYTQSGDFNNGDAGIYNWLSNYLVSETYLTWDRDLGDIHHLTIMAGQTFENYMQRSSTLKAYGFLNESLGNESMVSGEPEMNQVSNDYGASRLLSFIGRINYTLKNRYLLTFTMRSDASTKFGGNNKWASFPSGAISWKAHEEEFIRDLNIFDELKFRLSYGISGNQAIPSYQTVSKYGIEQYYYNDAWRTVIGPGYVSGYTGDDYRFKVWRGIPNLDIRWETTSQFDFGIDLGLMNRKVTAVFDYYRKYTYDLLRLKYLPLSSGYDEMWVNDGEIQNTGFEFTLNGNIISQKDYGLSASLIYSRNRNTLLALGDVSSSGLTADPNTGMLYEYWGNSLGTFSMIPNILAIGQPINVFYGYKVDGILQNSEDGLAQGLTGDFAQPGEFKYLDVNEDGTFDQDDRTIIGDPNPDFTMSLSLNGRIRNFDLEIFLNGVFGNDVINYTKWGGQPNTAPLRWTQDNPNNDYPSLRDNRTYYFSDWWIEDGSFVRIQNASLGYNVRAEKISWLQNMRFYVSAQNLYTFSKFAGYDPEVSTKGIYSGGYPRLRRVTVGLDITF